MAGAVAAASADQKTPGAYYDVERMHEHLLAGNSKVLRCSTWLEARD